MITAQLIFCLLLLLLEITLLFSTSNTSGRNQLQGFFICLFLRRVTSERTYNTPNQEHRNTSVGVKLSVGERIASKYREFFFGSIILSVWYQKVWDCKKFFLSSLSRGEGRSHGSFPFRIQSFSLFHFIFFFLSLLKDQVRKRDSLAM